MQKMLSLLMALTMLTVLCACQKDSHSVSGDDSLDVHTYSDESELSSEQNAAVTDWFSGLESEMPTSDSSSATTRSGNTPSSKANTSSTAPTTGTPGGSRAETATVSQNFVKTMSYNPSNGSIAHNFGSVYLTSGNTGLSNASGSKVAKQEASAAANGKGGTISQKLSGGQLDTTLNSNSDGTLSLSQRAASNAGVSSVYFTLVVSMDYNIIVPAWGGVRLTKAQPEFYYGANYRLAYPNDWQAQMLLIQGNEGGLLLYACDTATQFKALTVTHDSANFYITIETIPQAPFTQYSSFQTVDWKLVPYKSAWTEGAKLYKDYTNSLFQLSAKSSQKADWASKVQFVILDDLDNLSLIDAYADVVEPSQTMILVPGWRKEPYDVNYPDYTPKTGIKDKIAYAQRLGFKVCVHCNMIGAETSSSDYQKTLTNACSLNAYTQQPIVESYTANGNSYAFAQINPASSAWRNLLVSKLKQVVKDTGVNAIHLDQSLLCFNDGRGLVEGMTSMQGSIQLLKELKEALPNIAFSGEGLTEIDMQYISFLQLHVYGINSATKTYSDNAIQQICPISTAIFGEYTSTYHYPALPITNNEAYYNVWYRAGMRTGLLPTIMRESITSIRKPNEAMKTVLKQAKWQQEFLPKINIINPWAADATFCYTLKDGSPLTLR